jgi:hypothetical protein
MILNMFGFTNMEVVVGFSVVAIFMERPLITILDCQFLSLVMATYWPSGHPSILDEVHMRGMSRCMNMNVVIGLDVVRILMGRLPMIIWGLQSLSPVMATCWQSEPEGLLH